jgi:chemotaxis-related protein WspD
MMRSEARARALTRCWASIGVLGGDRSCPLLKECAHCRECEVIAVAADDLLTRVPAAGDNGGAAGGLPAISSRAAPADSHMPVITFEVGGQDLALEVSRVVEVGAERPIRRVPHRIGLAFLGLVNVQGRLEPCLSLPAVLGLPERAEEAGVERRLIVIGDETRRCSFLAHRVALKEADPELVADPPVTVSAALDTHVRGILRLGGRLWSWLDADRLLTTLEARLR